MFLRKGFILIVLFTILVIKFKPVRGRFYEDKYKSHRTLNKLNYRSFQTRHYNHYLHKKHHKCHSERSSYKDAFHSKPSRYPTLDKIVHRLDNRIDYSERIKISTPSPFSEWNTTSGVTTTTPNKSSIYTYYTVGLKSGGGKTSTKATPETEVWIKEDSSTLGDSLRVVSSMGGRDGDSKSVRKKIGELRDNDNDNNVIDESNNVLGKKFMGDHTTSSPWENEQHDVSSRTGGGFNGSDDFFSISSTPSLPLPWINETSNKETTFNKLPFWPISRILPKKDDKKKQTTPMPYVAAHEHYEQVLRMGDCHIPKEKVIRVHEVHPDPSKSYSPSCTILHQCGDDTGCCRDLKQVCKPKNFTKVELYFFTTTVGKQQTVEKLHFLNHTECECQKRTEDTMPRDSEFRRHHIKKVTGPRVGEEKRKRNACTCPSKYSARFLRNETCICDCFDKQDDCLVLKKGKAHFSYHDKLCIQQEICRPPSCEFGSYIRQFGRCPNRSEKYHYSWSRILSYKDLIT